MQNLKQLFYRGFEIDEQSNGGWTVTDPTGSHSITHNGAQFLTDEDAMNAVDAHKRALRAAQG